jgi:hypothetical protein
MFFWNKKLDQNSTLPVQPAPEAVLSVPIAPVAATPQNPKISLFIVAFIRNLPLWKKLLFFLVIALIIATTSIFFVQRYKNGQTTLSSDEFIFVYDKYAGNQKMLDDLYSKYSQDKVVKRLDPFIIENPNTSSNYISYKTEISSISDKIVFDIQSSKENKPLAGHFADYVPYFRTYLTKDEVTSMSLTQAEIEKIFTHFDNEPSKYYLDSLTDSDLRDSLESLNISPAKISDIIEMFNKKPQLTVLNNSICANNIAFASDYATVIPLCLKIIKTQSTYFVVSIWGSE